MIVANLDAPSPERCHDVNDPLPHRLRSTAIEVTFLFADGPALGVVEQRHCGPLVLQFSSALTLTGLSGHIELRRLDAILLRGLSPVGARIISVSQRFILLSFQVEHRY